MSVFLEKQKTCFVTTLYLADLTQL